MPKIATVLEGGAELEPGLHEAVTVDVIQEPNGDVTVKAAVLPNRDPKTKKLRPGAIGEPILSGHCQVAERVGRGVTSSNKSEPELHAICKGAVSNGAGTTWLCSCGCHDRLVCHLCSHDHGTELEAYDSSRRICSDPEGCRDNQAARTERSRRTNPLFIQLEQLRAERAARATESTSEGTEDQPGPVAGVRGAKPRKAAPEPQRCHCGCAGMTKGGMFVPGHDMRLKSRLWDEANAGSVEAGAEIVARGWKIKGVTAGLPATLDPAATAISDGVERRYAE